MIRKKFLANSVEYATAHHRRQQSKTAARALDPLLTKKTPAAEISRHDQEGTTRKLR